MNKLTSDDIEWKDNMKFATVGIENNKLRFQFAGKTMQDVSNIYYIVKRKTKQVKTVWDAVNFSKAINYSSGVTGERITYHKLSKAYYISAEAIIDAYVIEVCTIEQFNQCVDDMSNFAGNEQYGLYLEHGALLTKESSDYSYYEDEALESLPDFSTPYHMTEQCMNDVIDVCSSSYVSNAAFKHNLQVDKEDEAEQVISAIAESINSAEYTPSPRPLVKSKLTTEAIDRAIKKSMKEMDDKINGNFKYTPEMKSINATPEADMLCRIEHDAPLVGLTIDEFTFKFESEKEYCGLDKDGYCLAISKDALIAWHCVDECSELDIAQKSQLISYQVDIEQKQDELQSDFTVSGMLEYMQDNDMLAEIRVTNADGKNGHVVC